jgi:F-type H+-transporting ATPase subunit b
MISVDFTILLQMANFLIILFIGKKMILDPVTSTMDKRNKKIDDLLASAAGMKDSIERQKQEYEEKLQQVKAEVSEHHRKVRESVLKETNEKVAKAKEELDAKVKAAREEIQVEYEKAKESLKADAESFAEAIVEKITGKAA